MYKPQHAGGAAAAGALASTGSHTIQIVLLALLLLVSGVMLLRVSRLRGGDN